MDEAGLDDADRDDAQVHSRRISSTACVIALELGVAPKLVELISDAARLHDIGKVGVPDSIRHTPRVLSEPEFELMKRHTTIGAELLSGSATQVLRLAEQVARCHHERWDGGGYPGGLAGTQTPLAARIVAVADAFDAIAHRRSYKPALGADVAKQAVLAERGGQFDPSVVDAFSRIDAGMLGTAGA